MSSSPVKTTNVKENKSSKLTINTHNDRLDRAEQIRRKKIVDSSYPFEEHGL
jgi:hypothetical protein